MFEYGQLPVFFDLIKKGNIEVLEELIISKTDMSEISEYGLNALHYAASLMQVDVMRLLLAKKLFKADEAIKEGRYAGNTALHWVCLAAERYPERAIEAVELLLANGADMKAKDRDGYTPLFSAVSSGHVELVKFLLETGEDVNSSGGDYDESLLHFAMAPCKRPMLKLLIDSGADIHYVSGLNREPIHEAAAEGCVDGLRELILTRMVSKHQKSPNSRENKCKAGYDSYCLFEATPLHFAAKFETLPAIEFLFLIQSNGEEFDENKLKAVGYAQSLEIKDYFYDRANWELERRSVYKRLPDVESFVRATEQPNCIDAQEKCNNYLESHLHRKRTYDK